MNEIKRLTFKDMLNDFYNYHLKEFVSATINMDIWSNMSDKNATAFNRPGPVQPDGRSTQMKVKVGEALSMEQARCRNNQRILQTIQKLDNEDFQKRIDEEFKTDVEKIYEHNQGERGTKV